MRISLIGSGRVATHLAQALAQQHEIVNIYSPTLINAQQLAESVDAIAIDQLSALVPDLDLIIIAVKDQAILACVEQLDSALAQVLVVHTSGSTDLSVIATHHPRAGVFYPLQSFSFEREIDWSQTPILIETAQSKDQTLLLELAKSLSERVYPYNSQQRLSLHLAAVFASNFSNYCYDIAAQIVQQQHVDFDLLKPLIVETALKATQQAPDNAQTGPARRGDVQIIAQHQALLAQQQQHAFADIYQIMSQGIIERHKLS